MPKAHDRGGWPADEPIDASEHQWSDWEQQTSAVMRAISSKGLLNTDELRRGIESIPADQYEVLSYFERWSASIETILVEKNVLTTEEIDQKVKALEERWG